PSTQPGGGNPTLRKQLRVLSDFIYGFDFIQMKPDRLMIKGVPSGMSARALAQPGKAYAVYLRTMPSPGEFSVRWTGSIEPKFSEEYTFHTFSNDGVRLWVDEQLIIDNWTEHSVKEDTGKVTLKADRRYQLKIEYFYTGGAATMKLWWASPTQALEAIPSNQLSPFGGGAQGLRGDYFSNRNFGELMFTRTDPEVNFDWAGQSPFAPAPQAAETILLMELPPGTYRAEWVNTKNGSVEKTESFRHAGGERRLAAPLHQEDIALRVKEAS
ncbi:MAG: hypothetical protein H0T92_14885, partial [Pyrinomonadaceae bacterium]|nr:hypothetical protein [Pyrinomonadaceae bacterium]